MTAKSIFTPLQPHYQTGHDTKFDDYKTVAKKNLQVASDNGTHIDD